MQIELGRYKHYKGAEYEVINLARHSETEQWHVIYRQCYGDEGLWIRPLDMFIEQVRLENGQQIARFAKI
ncbi:DUF1653 domain-containing protein [Neptuniibacter marinus]|uniref:DUF1653 domain-containing protein n=1 Tax=Neptuniibacter marinus TaxID=1806670 RepID=UPI00082B3079|nr:DUF1653 domain-containing protein [Neptuniibacter marinus]